MTAVIWTRRARLDAASIYAFIADDNTAAADALRSRIFARVADLPDSPLAHRAGRLPGTREMVVHPNYIVVYRATETSITILRILHSARNWP